TGPGNVISANGQNVFLQGPGSSGNLVRGNIIGTDAAALGGLDYLPAGGSSYGVTIRDGAGHTTVGGARREGSTNLISGNGNGVDISDSTNGPGGSANGAGNVVRGNLIGTTLDGNGAIPNGNGIEISLYATGEIIGGTAPGDGNVISGNTLD